MKLTFIGAAHEVTGSCTLLDCCGGNFLIDYGMEQGVYAGGMEPDALAKDLRKLLPKYMLPNLYEKLDTQALLQSVDAAKELKPDVILVMLHWGSEATLEVTKTQQSLAKQLFERGADAILGTHSHLVGKMETSYCAAPVAWAVALRVTSGTSAITFSPDALCTRAQIVTFLYRANA